MSDNVPNSNNKLQSMLAQPSSGYKSGVDTPSRFASKCRGPPPISERHLIHALQNQKLQEEKASESHAKSAGNDDDALQLQTSGSSTHQEGAEPSSSLPSSSSAQRGQGPSGAAVPDRRADEGKDEDRGANGSPAGQGTPRPKRPNLHESKSKAFAFFGQVSIRRVELSGRPLTCAGRLVLRVERLAVRSACLGYCNVVCQTFDGDVS